MKKRVLALFIAVFLLVLFISSCGKDNDISINISTNSNASSQPSLSYSELLEIVKQHMPIIDGSTSTIPLEAGIRSALLGISKIEAEAQVSHTTTYGSFDKLINGKCDIIFSVPLSQEQYDNAASKGIELETTPIAMEGFVFVVNADNPVESLTQQQIKDIYSGKIKNWKEVGGKDAEIVAYQRNATSGSQNYMIAFMKNTKLMEPKTDTVPHSMGGLMDAIASYDNSANAIGYSVYSYAAEMYISASKVKFIKIDGIAPSSKTMADSTYPLLSYNYAVINAESPADSTERTLIKWILTDEGQKAVADSGYIPVAKIQSSLEADIVMPLLSDGTGKEKPSGYKLPNSFYGVNDFNFLKYDETKDHKYINWRIEGLKNTKIQNDINDFITSFVAAVESKEDEALTYIEKNLESSYFEDTSVKAECINGYLSVVISLIYYDGNSGLYHYYKPISLVWDLYTGKKLNFTDMFWKNEKFIKTVNNGISKKLNDPNGDYNLTYELLGEFWALPNYFNNFSLTNVYFSSGESVFLNGVGVDYSFYCKDLLVTGELRDMAGIWKDKSVVFRAYHEYTGYDVGKGTYYDDYYFWSIDQNESGINETVCNKINDYMSKAADEKLSKKALDARFGENNYIICDMFSPSVLFTVYGKSFIIYNGNIELSKNSQEYETLDSISISTIFDYNTGNILTLDDILSSGWKKAIVWSDEKIDINKVIIEWIRIDSIEKTITIFVYDSNTKTSTSFDVPYKYLIFK